MWHVVGGERPLKSQLPSFYDLGKTVFVDWEENNDLMS